MMAISETDNRPQMLGEILIGPPEMEAEFKRVKEMPLHESMPILVSRAGESQKKLKEAIEKLNERRELEAAIPEGESPENQSSEI